MRILNWCRNRQWRLLLVATSFLSFDVFAQTLWATTSVETNDALEDNVILKDEWVGGYLRFSVVLKDERAPWTLTFLRSDGESQVVASTSAAPLVFHSIDGPIIIDFPVSKAGAVAVRSSDAISVSVVEASTPSDLNTQQMLGAKKITSFPSSVESVPNHLARTFGRLDLLDANRKMLGACTAFRIQNGYWLTAGHCVLIDPTREGPIRPKAWRIAADHYVDSPPKTFWEAGVVATGQSHGLFNPSLPMTPSDLDFAILSVPGDVGARSLPLSTAPRPASYTPLELLQQWSGTVSPGAGKATSVEDNCVEIEREGLVKTNDPTLCPGGVQHSCSTEEGSSGGALIDRSSATLMALHYRAGRVGRFNCALSMDALVSFLRINRPELAAKLIH